MFFKTYRIKRDVDKVKGDVRQLWSLLEDFLNMVTQEKQKSIIETEKLWDLPDIDKEILLEKFSRKQEEVKQIYDKYKMRIEKIEWKIHTIENQLPPWKGLNRLRYLNPWMLVLIGVGIAAILFALTQERGNVKIWQPRYADREDIDFKLNQTLREKETCYSQVAKI